MAFNFDSVFKDMTKALTDGLAAEGEHIITSGQDIINQTKSRMENLTTLYLAGSINKEHFDLGIEDVIDVLTSALSTALKLPI